MPDKSNPELIQIGSHSRRDFLSLMGFTMAATALAGCRAPVQYATPLVSGSDQAVPGVSNYYATTCGGCAASCSLLVKQRDGRAIKVEGNDRSELFGGGTCATGQAMVLGLYDDERLRGPLWKGRPAKWEDIDARVAEGLRAAAGSGRSIVLLSGTITSPSMLAIIEGWRARYPQFRHVMYDPISASAMRAAYGAIPHYRFEQARVIVGIEADFLGTWISPVEFARGYARARNPEGEFALHVQWESGLSVTGSNADLRMAVAPSEMGPMAVRLLRRIAGEGPAETGQLEAVAQALLRHRGESLVVCGVQDPAVQTVVSGINALLGNLGKTIDLDRPSRQRGGDDRAMAELVDEMNRGKVHTLMVHGANPAYDYADSDGFLKGLAKVNLSISFADRRDETSARVDAICPDHHSLESWGDAEPVDSHFSLSQPTMAPLFETRAAAESLLAWLETPATHLDYLRAFWEKNLFSRQTEVADFTTFWDRALENGAAVLPGRASTAAPPAAPWQDAAAAIEATPPRGDGYELHFYESVSLRDGRHANNPWLQELPDPITKVTWSNFAAVSPKLAAQLSLSNGDILSLKTERGAIELLAWIQPGQEARTISVALGYGRRQTGKAGDHVGANAYPLAPVVGGFRRYAAQNVTLRKTGRNDELASTQSHFAMEGRPIVLESTLQDVRSGGAAPVSEPPANLWADHPAGEHLWGMTLDLSACTGCSACVIACQAENNVPVVGKDQVRRTRIMHWIRLDHYYSGPEDNPTSLHQPMMCQHCGHAPCETVCPVLATTTSSEGINQQVYNRCIGTRYCANNCPYKVRRFNFYNYTQNPEFDFNMESPLGRMVLNPDVVVRTRGVMEKCDLCVQRIQLAKNLALQQGRPLADGNIQTACQQSCPTQAIVFGDLRDPQSRVSRLRQDHRFYSVLEDLGTQPHVGYLKKVRHTI